ncbi:MAG TPA: hypothetical protein VMU05_14410 [Dongiaceae bacterium]|nr:hypothetical protein [Dongiaceae bacterium]
MKVTKLEPVGELPLLITVQRLPGSVPERAGLWQELSLPQWQELCLVVDTSEGFHFRDGLLMRDGASGVIPATQENLAAARLGPGKGWISPAHPLNLPVFIPSKAKIDVR